MTSSGASTHLKNLIAHEQGSPQSHPFWLLLIILLKKSWILINIFVPVVFYFLADLKLSDRYDLLLLFAW